MESSRVRLRRFNTNDRTVLHEIYSDPEVVRYTPARVPQTEEQTQTKLQTFLDNEVARAPLGLWAAETLDRSDFIGLFMLLKTEREFPELGFMIGRRHWQKGFATEIARRLVEFGLDELQLPGLTAGVDQPNVNSKRVLEKLGFRFVKTIIKADKILARDYALDWYQLRREWIRGKPSER